MPCRGVASENNKAPPLQGHSFVAHKGLPAIYVRQYYPDDLTASRWHDALYASLYHTRCTFTSFGQLGLIERTTEHRREARERRPRYHPKRCKSASPRNARLRSPLKLVTVLCRCKQCSHSRDIVHNNGWYPPPPPPDRRDNVCDRRELPRVFRRQ